jgi:hypothetical protein
MKFTSTRTLTPFALALAGSMLLSTTAMAQGLSNRIEQVRQNQQRAEARNTDKAHMLSVLLYTDISVQFNDTPARDAINYLQTVLGINIVGRYMDDRTGFGLDPEAGITLDADNQPALTVLERVLEQAAEFDETTWQLRQGFVEVGTKDRLAARNAREIRYYPIRDLLFEIPVFDNAPQFDLNQALEQGGGQGGQGGGGGGGGGGRGGGGGGGGGAGGGGGLFGEPGADPERMSEEDRAQQIIDLIVETVEPEAWDVLGGEWATIRYYHGQLIIRAPDFIHRQIGGYPYAVRARSGAQANAERRYVTFSGGISNVRVVDVRNPRDIGERAGGSESSTTKDDN